jgi:hypothetical protein
MTDYSATVARLSNVGFNTRGQAHHVASGDYCYEFRDEYSIQIGGCFQAMG